MEKEIRNTFVTTEPQEFVDKISNELEVLTKYCANDVKATKLVFEKLFPLYLDQYDSPISFYGSLIMGKPLVHVNQDLFDENFKAENSVFEEKMTYISQRLGILAQKVRRYYCLVENVYNNIFFILVV